MMYFKILRMIKEKKEECTRVLVEPGSSVSGNSVPRRLRDYAWCRHVLCGAKTVVGARTGRKAPVRRSAGEIVRVRRRAVQSPKRTNSRAN